MCTYAGFKHSLSVPLPTNEKGEVLDTMHTRMAITECNLNKGRVCVECSPEDNQEGSRYRPDEDEHGRDGENTGTEKGLEHKEEGLDPKLSERIYVNIATTCSVVALSILPMTSTVVLALDILLEYFELIVTGVSLSHATLFISDLS